MKKRVNKSKWVALLGLLTVALTLSAGGEAFAAFTTTKIPSGLVARPKIDYTINPIYLRSPDLVINSCEFFSENGFPESGPLPLQVRIRVKNNGDRASTATEARDLVAERELFNNSQWYPAGAWSDGLDNPPPYNPGVVPALNPGQQAWVYMGEIEIPEVCDDWNVGLTFEVDDPNWVREKSETNNLFDCAYFRFGNSNSGSPACP